jgi:hypothetical protein
MPTRWRRHSEVEPKDLALVLVWAFLVVLATVLVLSDLGVI